MLMKLTKRSLLTQTQVIESYKNELHRKQFKSKKLNVVSIVQLLIIF